MSQRRLWNRIIIGGSCFILSAIISLPFFSAWRDALAIVHPQPTPTNPVSETRTYATYAVVWVDDFTKPSPLVEAVWIAWVPSDHSTIELEYLPPESYNPQYSRDPAGVAIASLPVQVKETFGGTVTLDHSDLGEIADLLGGIQLADQTLQASDLVAYLTISPTDQPAEILVRQAAVTQGLIAQLTLAGRRVSVRDLLVIPSHITLEEQVVSDIVSNYYPLRLEAVRVRATLHTKVQP